MARIDGEEEMDREHDWEMVYRSVVRPVAITTLRMKVPNGWVYCHTVAQTHWFGRDDFSQSTVFVPDPATPGAQKGAP
jgi:hypothetical protein